MVIITISGVENDLVTRRCNLPWLYIAPHIARLGACKERIRLIIVRIYVRERVSAKPRLELEVLQCLANLESPPSRPLAEMGAAPLFNMRLGGGVC